MTNILQEPVKIGHLDLQNHIAMAPMTRCRATADGLLGEITATYYRQRGTAGLIIAEGTAPAANGSGYMNIPGLYNDAQQHAWAPVIEAAQSHGAKFFIQLMHTGRIGHEDNQGGHESIAPTASTAPGEMYTPHGPKPHSPAREATAEDIKEAIAGFRHATRRAIAAGADGVELHAASGYLPHEFLSAHTNHRTDEYGGSVENQTRFVLDALRAMIEEAGEGKVGIKISPGMPFNDIGETEGYEPVYEHLAKEMSTMGLAYVHYMNANQHNTLRDSVRKHFGGPFLLGAGLTHESAVELLNEGTADIAVFGNLFIGNPDLPERFAKNADLSPSDQATYYGGGENGYITYPTLEEQQA